MLQLRKFVHFKKYFFRQKDRKRDRIGTVSKLTIRVHIHVQTVQSTKS